MVATTAPRTTDASAPQRSTRTVPKAPTSQSASVTSDTRTPTTPAKSKLTLRTMDFLFLILGMLAYFLSHIIMLCSVGLVPGDASPGFAFQFGSISPGFMNGMQVLLYACELLMKILLFPI